MNEDNRFLEMATVVTYINTVTGALANLRDGERGRALESLEFSLDQSVLTLSALTKQVEPGDREIVIQTLRYVRDYRRSHPRRSEFDMSRLDKCVVAKAYEMRENAQKILDEVE